MSLQVRVENSEDMDHLLLEIKNFLKKLETGQLEIEAGQWELHKELANMKQTIEEMRKLKEDVEEMKLNNAEAMELIRELENKLESYKVNISGYGPRTFSDSSEESEEIYKMSNDHQNNSKGSKKRCRRLPSEKIIEIPSDVDSIHTEKQEKSFRGTDSSTGLVEKHDCSAENEAPAMQQEQQAEVWADHSCPKKKRRTRKPDGVIMERYLNDSAKYRNRGSSNSSEKKNVNCTSTLRPEPEHGAYWDGLSRKKPKKSQQQSPKDNWTTESFEKVAVKEAVIPKRFFCPKCSKSFALNREFMKHHSHAHEKRKRRIYCKMCKKLYDEECTLKDHKSVHFVKSKSRNTETAPYKCSYCKKTSSSPEQLTAHLRRCRIITKAGIKRK